MTIPLDDLRYEIKFVVPRPEAYRMHGWLKTHAEGFRVAYPPRNVNNVYFDNFDLATYDENLSGVSERTKIRLRWYGVDKELLDGRLELKQKKNRLGWKTTFKVQGLPFIGRSWRQIGRDLRERLPMEAQHWLDLHPEPVIINRYEREYFVSRDGQVRITLDTGLTVLDQRLSRSPNRTARTNLPDVMIVEAKAVDRAFRELGRVVSDIPVRVGRFSKYVNGLQTILTST